MDPRWRRCPAFGGPGWSFRRGDRGRISGEKDEMRHVAIFRHNLFRISEPFITQQAQQLRRYTPLYLGRLRFGNPPEGAASTGPAGPRAALSAAARRLADDHPGPAALATAAGRAPAFVDPRAFRHRRRVRASLGAAAENPAGHHVPWLRCHAFDRGLVVLARPGRTTPCSGTGLPGRGLVPLRLRVHPRADTGAGLSRGTRAESTISGSTATPSARGIEARKRRPSCTSRAWSP